MRRLHPFLEFRTAGGRTPSSGVIGESFWAGYHGIGGTRQGVAKSLARQAYEAGVARAKVEPGLNHKTLSPLRYVMHTINPETEKMEDRIFDTEAARNAAVTAYRRKNPGKPAWATQTRRTA